MRIKLVDRCSLRHAKYILLTILSGFCLAISPGFAAPVLQMPKALPDTISVYKSVTVFAGWTRMHDTGVLVKEGDDVSIIAKGQIDLAPKGNVKIIRSPDRCLMYRIGKRNLMRFYSVLDFPSVKMEKSGNIYLGYMGSRVDEYGDAFPTQSSFYTDDEGFFIVDIIVWRKYDPDWLLHILEDTLRHDPKSERLRTLVGMAKVEKAFWDKQKAIDKDEDKKRAENATEAKETGTSSSSLTGPPTLVKEKIDLSIQPKTAREVSSVAFSPDGKYALSGISDGIIVWDVPAGKEKFRSKSNWVCSVAFSPDGKYALGGSLDGTITLWNVLTGEKVRTYKRHKDRVNSVAFSPDGRYILSGSSDNALKLLDGKYISSASDNNTALILWDVSSGRVVRTFAGNFEGISSVAFSPDGKYVLAGVQGSRFPKHTLKLWHISKEKEVRTFEGHLGPVQSVDFSPDGQHILSGSMDGTVKLWDASTGKELKTLKGHPSGVVSVAFSPSGRIILSGGVDKIVRLWDVLKGETLWTLDGHSSTVSSVTFSPDNRYVLSGSEDGTTRIWGVSTGKEIARMAGFEDGEWVVITAEGYYNASPKGDSYLNVKVGNNTLGIGAYRSTFLNPQAVEAALGTGKPKKNLDEDQPPPKKIIATNETTKKESGPSLKETKGLVQKADELFQQGRYKEALPLAEKALAIREKELGPNHVDVATCLLQLGEIYMVLGEYAKAEPLYERSLTIREKVLGREHPTVAATLSSYGFLYYRGGDYTKAEPLLKRALSIREKVLGPDHSSVASTVNNLALLLRALGDYAKSEPLFKRALSIREQALGYDHPLVATTINDMGFLYYHLGDYQKADALLKTALKIREKALNIDHPSLAITLHNLGLIYRRFEESIEAESYFKKALAIQEKAYDPNHPDVIGTQNSLAILYLKMGKVEEAFNILRKNDHVMGLGRYYLQVKDYEKAEKEFHRSLEQDEKKGLKESLVADYLGLGYAAEGKEDYQEARDYFTKATELIEGQSRSLDAKQRTVFLNGRTVTDFSRKEPYERLEHCQKAIAAIAAKEREKPTPVPEKKPEALITKKDSPQKTEEKGPPLVIAKEESLQSLIPPLKGSKPETPPIVAKEEPPKKKEELKAQQVVTKAPPPEAPGPPPKESELKPPPILPKEEPGQKKEESMIQSVVTKKPSSEQKETPVSPSKESKIEASPTGTKEEPVQKKEESKIQPVAAKKPSSEQKEAPGSPSKEGKTEASPTVSKEEALPKKEELKIQPVAAKKPSSEQKETPGPPSKESKIEASPTGTKEEPVQKKEESKIQPVVAKKPSSEQEETPGLPSKESKMGAPPTASKEETLPKKEELKIQQVAAKEPSPERSETPPPPKENKPEPPPPIKPPKPRDITPPTLTLTTPDLRDGMKVAFRVSRITVSGKAQDESGVAEVLVNGELATLDEEGNFAGDVLLKIGQNEITVTATDIHKNQATQSFKVVREGQKITPPKMATALKTKGKYYAILIGIDGYKYVPRLQTAKKDATEVEKILRERFGFETRLLLDTTRMAILNAINDFRKKLREEDNLLIYYAGHGEYDKIADKAYWLPADAERDNPTNWIMADDITTNIKRMASKHILIVSDSCYSGTFVRRVVTDLSASSSDREGFIKRMLEKTSRTLMASGGNEPVLDSGGSGHSIFAEAFLKALREVDEDIFTADELFYSFVREKVIGRSEQTPEYNNIRNSGHEGGDFVFMKK